MNAQAMRSHGAAEWKDTEPLEAAAAPRLWNPAAAACWSLLFTPVFGAALHMHNWRALGDEENARLAKGWMLASLGILAVMILVGMVLPESKELDRVQRSVGTGLLFAWYFTAARAQQKLVKERFGKDYPRKGWTRPIGAALLALLGLFLVCLVVVVVAG